VRPRPRTPPVPADDPFRWLTLDRAQRNALQRLIIDLELGDWAAHGFVLDAADPDEQHARRERIECAFAILDDLGWATDDSRETYHVLVRDPEAMGRVLLQWRDWQVQAIEDVHLERAAGAPVGETAPTLLVAAERLGVVAGMLRRLVDAPEGRA
jgi:hypothetical protein